MKSSQPSRVVLGLMGGILATIPSFAHHSFMAEFDQEKAIVVDGVVTAVQWQNPHTFFNLDVTDKSGKVVKWILETGSPNALIMRGWSQKTMKVGDRVTVHGYRAKAGSNLAAARSVTLADGRTIFGGQTDDGGPSQ